MRLWKSENVFITLFYVRCCVVLIRWYCMTMFLNNLYPYSCFLLVVKIGWCLSWSLGIGWLSEWGYWAEALIYWLISAPLNQFCDYYLQLRQIKNRQAWNVGTFSSLFYFLSIYSCHVLILPRPIILYNQKSPGFTHEHLWGRQFYSHELWVVCLVLAQILVSSFFTILFWPISSLVQSAVGI